MHFISRFILITVSPADVAMPGCPVNYLQTIAP